MPAAIDQVVFTHSEKPPDQKEKFRGGQMRVEIRILRQETDLTQNLAIAGRFSQNQGIAPVGAQEPEEDFEEGCLAGTVWSQQAVGFSFPDGKRDGLKNGSAL